MRTLLPWQPPMVKHLTSIRPGMNGLPHAFLGAEMGLGKTDVGAASAKGINATSGIILCPVSVIEHWATVLVEWGVCAPDEIFWFDKCNQKIPAKAKFIIVNYQKVWRTNVLSQLLERKYDFIIYDEAQNLKSPSARCTKAVYVGNKKKKQPSLASRAYWKWQLSGTPMLNDVMELYAHARTHAPHLLGKYTTREEFGNRYSYRRLRNNEWVYVGSKRVVELREMLAPYLMMVRAQDVFTEMPAFLVEPTYLDIHFNEIGGDEKDTSLATLRNLVGLAKVPYVVQYAKEFIERTKEKVIIYTYSREVTEQITEQLAMYGAVKYYGGMSKKQKDAAKNEFIKNDSCKVIVLNLVSGGTGTDGLQLVCYNMIFAEWDWQGGGFKQQVGRLVRYLQKSKTVYAHALIAKGTLDERIIKSRKQKVRDINTLAEPTEKENDMLETFLERIAVALESIAAQGKSQTSTASGAKNSTSATSETKPESAPSADAKKEEKAKEPDVTKEDCRKLCADFLALFTEGVDSKDKKAMTAAVKAGRAPIEELFAKHKVENCDGLKGKAVKEFANAVIALINAKQESADEASEEDEADTSF